MAFRTPAARATGTTARTVAAAVRGVPVRTRLAATQALAPHPVVPTLDELAHQRAAHDIASLLAGIPSAASVTQPYAQAGQQVDAQTQGLLDQLRGEQTYRVNLATGLPQAVAAGDAALQQQANQSAAALGGTASALPSTAAAGTLASFGTSAANQVAQQEATAPLVGMQYHSALNQSLLKALNDRQLQVGSANARLPGLEDQYRSELTSQKQAADQQAFQREIAQKNYDLATGKATSDLQYRYDSLAASNKRAAASTAASNQRAAASRQNQWKLTQARITASSQNAAANRDAASQRAAAATAKQRSATLGRTQQYVDQQLQSRYKPKAGTGGATSGYSVTYQGAAPNPADPTSKGKSGARTVKPEQWQAYIKGGKKDPTLLNLPSDALVGTATPITKSGTPGTGVTNPDRAVDWARGYIARQNAAYGWGLSTAEVTRLAQQSVRDSGIWPKYARRSHPNTPGVVQARARGRRVS